MIKVRFERREPSPEVSRTYLLESAVLEGADIMDKGKRFAYIDYGGIWHTCEDGKVWDKIILG